MVLNRFPLWKNLLVIGVVLIAFLYAAPNLFGDDPAIQIMGANASITLDQTTENSIKQALDAKKIFRINPLKTKSKTYWYGSRPMNSS